MNKLHAIVALVLRKSQVSKLRRRVFEFFGSSRYSRFALNNLEEKLERYLNYRNGVFVELGANDGLTQSNTYYFEALRGWHGVLVEPIPHLYEQAVRNRPRAQVFNSACVAHEVNGTHIDMLYANLMSIVMGAFGDQQTDSEYISKASRIQRLTPYTVKVPARTLTSILNEAGLTTIDFLSLDVEGYELEVLRGLDLDQYCPKYILVETTRPEEIIKYLSEKYSMVEHMSELDFFFAHKA